MIPLTALLLTHNEEENISRTLGALSFVDRVLIVDSGSTDQTVEIARAAHPAVEILTRTFDSFAAQCNFGRSHIDTEWVLSLDADYILTSGLVSEIINLNPTSEISGYSVEFRYCVFGRPLRSTVYPARTVIYRNRLAVYRDEGHGHRVVVTGRIRKLSGKIDHDDRKPLSRWLEAQDKYAVIETAYLLTSPQSQLSFADRLRKRVLFAAPAMFCYLLFGRGLLLDGWAGWVYVIQRTIAELMLSMRLLMETLKR